jgi:hypothetical protein
MGVCHCWDACASRGARLEGCVGETVVGACGFWWSCECLLHRLDASGIWMDPSLPTTVQAGLEHGALART